MCIYDCGGGTILQPYMTKRVKRDDYDPDMTKIKFKIHAKYDWKAHARMANKMAAKWKEYYWTDWNLVCLSNEWNFNKTSEKLNFCWHIIVYDIIHNTISYFTINANLKLIWASGSQVEL